MRFILILSALALAGCVGGGSGGGGAANQFSTACMFETDAPGTYVYSDNDDRVSGAGAATAESTAAMNACIARKAAAGGAASSGMGGIIPATTETTVAGPSAPAPVAKVAPARVSRPVDEPYCRRFGGVMQGGTRYCMGN